MKNLTNFNKNIFRAYSNSANNVDNKLKITCGWSQLVFDHNNNAIFYLRVDSFLLEVLKSLEDGYYTMHFFPNVETDKNNDCELSDSKEIENEKIIKCKEKIIYKSWLSLFINVDRSHNFACGNQVAIDTYKIIEKRVSFLQKEGLGRRGDYVNFMFNLIVLSKVDKPKFDLYDYTEGVTSVYDITTYTEKPDKDGNVKSYLPYTKYDFYS